MWAQTQRRKSGARTRPPASPTLAPPPPPAPHQQTVVSPLLLFLFPLPAAALVQPIRRSYFLLFGCLPFLLPCIAPFPSLLPPFTLPTATLFESPSGLLFTPPPSSSRFPIHPILPSLSFPLAVCLSGILFTSTDVFHFHLSRDPRQ